ncbi:MAG: hypothetical protein V1839_02900 [archaeon]
MRLSELIRYYTTQGIAAELLEYSESREAAVQFGDMFGKRPDALQFPSDIENAVRKGATSFHCSEERWLNPMQLKQESTKKELDELRVGWDLILDIDCKIFEWSKICAKLLLESLRFHNVSCATLKFSGGTGFHIGVPGVALSDEKLAFPETPQIIAQYLKEFIKPNLRNRIIELEQDVKKIVEKSKKKKEDVFKDGEFDPFAVMDIDTVAIAPRHLIRAPYSLNEKKWLVSLPIHEKQLSGFTQELAKPENVEKAEVKFLSQDVEPGSAAQLLIESMDWWYSKQIAQKADAKAAVVAFEFSEKVPKERFPPCMQLILKGLEDGRKRGLFALINFMKLAKWNWIEIESELKEWNNRNPKPLKQGYLQAQLSWHRRHAEKIPPPNCRDFYKDILVCKPDFTCDKIKNPISYPRFKNK